MNRYAVQQLLQLLLVGAIGLCALAGGLAFGWQSIQLRLLSPTVTGTVTRVDFGYDSDNDPRFAPEVEYEVAGQRYAFRSTHTSGNRKAWVKGQPITVYYNPRDPATAEIGDTMYDIVRPGCFLLFAALFLVPLTINTLKELRAARRRTEGGGLPPYQYPQ